MGTVGPSLVHSCTSELTRQGIWLPYSQSMGDHSSVKRVRVTPGVNRPLAQLNPGFRYLHWPGFISRTHPFGLATYCVFSKQSGPPCYCNLRTLFFTKNAGTTSS